MTIKKNDFYGKEVTDAIRKACDKYNVEQDELEIEVVETGSTGIFGLIRKKAHIRAHLKKSEGTGGKTGKGKNAPSASKRSESAPSSAESSRKKEEKKPESAPAGPAAEPLPKSEDAPAVAGDEEKPEESFEEAEEAGSAQAPVQTEKSGPKAPETGQPAGGGELSDAGEDDNGDDFNGWEEHDDEQEEGELPQEVLDLVKDELSRILELMGYPSPVDVKAKGTSVLCRVGEEHQEVLTGQDGKTLDSLQYLLRKIVARKVPDRLRLSVDVGNYRQQRLDGLKQKAVDLAEKVREDGKTQVIAALSPSERRVVHMSLQEDKEIRSRSVGDGLFKKILIYKPGKGGGKGGGRKRNHAKGKKTPNNRRKNG